MASAGTQTQATAGKMRAVLLKGFGGAEQLYLGTATPEA
jgi:hypothetical protein